MPAPKIGAQAAIARLEGWRATEGRDAITVPASAVRSNGQLQTVFVIVDNRVHATLVSIGGARDDRVEILSGLGRSDRIVTAPPANLTDGAPIEAAQ